MCTSKKYFKTRNGFTFTEVIISIAIVGITASFLAMSVPDAFLITRKTENLTKASTLASKYLETIKSNFAYKSEYDLATEGTTPPIALTPKFTDNANYTVTTEVIDLATETINGTTVATLKEINITYQRGTNILAELNTIIARPR